MAFAGKTKAPAEPTAGAFGAFLLFFGLFAFNVDLFVVLIKVDLEFFAAGRAAEIVTEQSILVHFYRSATGRAGIFMMQSRFWSCCLHRT